jgi:hypothetical protein
MPHQQTKNKGVDALQRYIYEHLYPERENSQLFQSQRVRDAVLQWALKNQYPEI